MSGLLLVLLCLRLVALFYNPLNHGKPVCSLFFESADFV
jgi:hypothetical protein